ncbi:Glycosyl hydrolase family 63 C-terminal domain-containing protein [Pseudarcicella hirudinis]|uniref:Glycosyl hydrolase family 63 C-terminal domain-containing protein n=1 Tax=Pseudarcicella hirudinis TaxID=1079859 RepID=A0A1I5U7X0_9BACT|nr:glucosidase [Pseudarcicella hirudinis]SFP91364.1 Glycosyl hydrolase family 63 C-terminal domain-containing protein [Pseudarcicella hirudinis]
MSNVCAEKWRLKTRNDNKGWKKWGPYLTERQWGTVREDYSSGGDAWNTISHDMARAKAYRWGEEGIGGISDNKQYICFALAFWNHKDHILKERLFGLTGNESNHGEDVKELYYYQDSTPTHSYMKMLYKYPQDVFPYEKLIQESRMRSRLEPEYELLDTGVFDEDEYFDISMEYSKVDEQDILIKITAHNRSDKDAPLTLLPTVWFRNTWCWGYEKFQYKPMLSGVSNSLIEIDHNVVGHFKLYCENADELLFCDNETNYQRLYGVANPTPFCKDGINNYIVDGDKAGVNPNMFGTKASARYSKMVKAGESVSIRLRFSDHSITEPFGGFEDNFDKRIREANHFYEELQKDVVDPELKSIQRQAYAGMLWTKQWYYYNVNEWIVGDPSMPKPNDNRKYGRNSGWRHMYAANIISMPDKWEYPWFAAWDLAFHTLPLARLDPDFAKRQLAVILREYYMHPNGQIPAYEWSFSDVNPPVHAWATWKVYEIDKEINGKGDVSFLERIFHKLLLNFTWWVNLKDEGGNNIFGGGFLGMDNIGVFDRSATLPTGGRLEQADGTGWMAMYSLNMLRIACEIATERPVYQDMASKFFEHFLHIAGAMQSLGGDKINLWDEEDQFYYDMLHKTDGSTMLLKIRSMVGLIPIFAVEVLTPEMLEKLPDFKRRVEWVLNNRPDLAGLISRWYEAGKGESRLLSILRGHRMKMIMKRMFDETEFLSDFGIRSLSKFHKDNPYEFKLDGGVLRVDYTPAESTGSMFGGNSNWRGPIWMPMNYLLIDSLLKFSQYYGTEYEVEYPTNSGQMVSIRDAAMSISERLIRLFTTNAEGERPVYEKYKKQQNDPHFKDLMLFYEYFDGDTGKGLGASHQTGWTGLVAELILSVSMINKSEVKELV